MGITGGNLQNTDKICFLVRDEMAVTQCDERMETGLRLMQSEISIEENKV